MTPHFMTYPLFLFEPLPIGIIFVVVLIVFGPGKLPDAFRALGEGVKQFKDASSGKPASTEPPAPPAP